MMVLRMVLVNYLATFQTNHDYLNISVMFMTILVPNIVIVLVFVMAQKCIFHRLPFRQRWGTSPQFLLMMNTAKTLPKCSDAGLRNLRCKYWLIRAIWLPNS